MITRREFSKGIAAMAVTQTLSACTGLAESYEQAVHETWRGSVQPFVDENSVYRELIRCATLAPNNHNTQPWKFTIEGAQVLIRPDLTRRCQAVDPDDHHLFVSLGCAAENAVLAARAHGFGATVSYTETGGEAIRISLDKAAKADETLWFRAIPQRESARSIYDGRAAPLEHLKLLENATKVDGVHVWIVTDSKSIEDVLAFVLQANTEEMANREIVGELKHWIRFDYADALATRDGLFSLCTGNPVLPAWLGNLAFDFAFRTRTENEKYTKQFRSSAGLAIFVADKSDKAHWIEVGRAVERFLLQATVLGMRIAFVNQPVEVPAVRSQLAAYLGAAERRPNLLVRFGYGPEMPRSLRRPVQSVIV